MDAQTMAAAALAVVVDNSRDAAVRELLSERDELANNLELARADLEIACDAMRGVFRHLEAGQVRWARAMLQDAIDDASEALGSLNVQAAREASAPAQDSLNVQWDREASAPAPTRDSLNVQWDREASAPAH